MVTQFPSVPVMRCNLLSVADAMTCDQWTRAFDWLPLNVAAIQTIANNASVWSEGVAAMLSAASWAQVWEEQIQAAPYQIQAILDGRPLAAIPHTPSGFLTMTMRRNMVKALEHGAVALKGPKQQAYVRLLCGDTTAVAVDVHVGRCLYGEWVGTIEIAPMDYPVLAGVVTDVAHALGITPALMTIGAWLYGREIAPQFYAPAHKRLKAAKIAARS